MHFLAGDPGSGQDDLGLRCMQVHSYLQPATPQEVRLKKVNTGQCSPCLSREGNQHDNEPFRMTRARGVGVYFPFS